jgi:Serine carboxypeptidase S28
MCSSSLRYFTDLSTIVIQILMQRFNGLGVILENRYYGKSYPFETSTTDNLAYLTTEQSEQSISFRSIDLSILI